LSVRVRLDPGDVVPDSPHLPALKPFGRNHHGEIRLSTSAGKCSGHIRLLAVWIFHSDDQHVLSHPALITRDIRSDAQRETFFPEQRVAAISRSVRPNLARLWEMHDVLFGIAWPGNIFLPRRQRNSNAVHARDHSFNVLVDYTEDRQPDAGHN